MRREGFVDDRSKSGQDIVQCVAVGGDGMTTNIWEVGVRAAAGKAQLRDVTGLGQSPFPDSCWKSPQPKKEKARVRET